MTNTNSSLAQFDFQGREVRVITIAGEPWWVAADVCAVLELAKTDRALAGLDDDEKGAHSVSTPGGDQQVSIINEPGLYSLVLRSRKPQARAFKRWITHEVIPSIRRTGRYAVEENPESQVPSEMTAFFNLIARAASEAFAVHARSAGRDAATMVEETLAAWHGRFARTSDELDERLRHALDGVDPGEARVGVPRQQPYRTGADTEEPPGEAEPIWHAGIPEGAMTFGALADLLSVELHRPDLSRDQLFAVARDAGLLRQLNPPYGGNTLTDARLSTLFRVRRISGANHGWPCTHHYQPLAMPQGVTIMRQLVAQDVARGVL